MFVEMYRPDPQSGALTKLRYSPPFRKQRNILSLMALQVKLIRRHCSVVSVIALFRCAQMSALSHPAIGFQASRGRHCIKPSVLGQARLA